MKAVKVVDLVEYDRETTEVTSLIVRWGERGVPREVAIAMLAAGIGVGITSCPSTKDQKALLAIAHNVLGEVLTRAAQRALGFVAGSA